MGCPSASETQTEACDAPACWTDSEIGPNAPFPVEVPAHRPGPSLASNPRMEDRLALSKALWRKVRTVMCQHAGQILEIGPNAPCHAEAPAPRPEPSLALSPKMVELLALSRTPSRKVKNVMCQLAGQSLEIGPSAPCHVEAPAPRPEPSLALSPKMVELLALSRTLSR